MREELLPYYERELKFIRQMSAHFAEKYPKVAGRLVLDDGVSEDPHVERLIEAFALLCGRVHHKLDDEFPEITEGLLEVLYPHFLRPIPSLAIAQFRMDESQSTALSVQVPLGTPVHSKPDNGQYCSFRTCYPVSVWPIKVKDASVSTVNRFATPGISANSAAVISIRLECIGNVQLSQLAMGPLRFYLHGELTAMHTLYEFLFLNAISISVRAAKGTTEAILPQGCIRQVGFERGEGLFPYSDRSFIGYRLLQEYFNFPEKFFFFDLTGLDRIAWTDFGSAFEILISLKEPDEKHRLIALEQNVDGNTFQLACTPVVNLFERIAEPVRLSHTKSEYRIIPDQHRQSSTEIYSVDRVTSTASYLQEPKTYEAFYSIRHGSQEDSQRYFWYTHRRPSVRKSDEGTEMYLTLVDTGFNPALPPSEMLSLRVTCTNRDQAFGLGLGSDFGELETEGVASLQTRCLRKPTETVRPPRKRGAQWRLISHLSLNHLSIVENGKESLQEILRLYDFSNDSSVQKQIAGIAQVRSRSSISRVISDTGVAFCRGSDVTIDFDEEQYTGTGVFLLSSVLERFLGLYSAVNSFSRLTARTRKGVLKQWSPRAGDQILL